MTRIELWSPRYHDNKVLIACHKVGVNNEIVFTKAPSMPGVYTIKGSEVEKCPKGTNGTIDVFEVPLSMLRRKDVSDEISEVVAGGSDNEGGNGQTIQGKLL